MALMDRAAGIGISPEHIALRDSVRGWTARHVPAAVPRALLDAEHEAVPDFWAELGAQRWLGLAVPTEHGGEGYGLVELVVVLEELGRSCVPGPFLPCALASAVLLSHGSESLQSELLAGLVSGDRIAGVGFSCAPVVADEQPGGALVVEGTWDSVLSGSLADVLLLPVASAEEGEERWVVLDADQVTAEEQPSIDRTRRVAQVHCRGVAVGAQRVLVAPTGPGGVAGLAGLLLSAEAVGIAGWCVDVAAEHALVREQFGRPIGQFQGVKHRCADMLCALEQARAASWDAARGGSGDEQLLVRAGASALAPDAAYRCAKDCIQVLGGIGFTWEHDAHVYLKRAMASRLALGGPAPWRDRPGETGARWSSTPSRRAVAR